MAVDKLNDLETPPSGAEPLSDADLVRYGVWVKTDAVDVSSFDEDETVRDVEGSETVPQYSPFLSLEDQASLDEATNDQEAQSEGMDLEFSSADISQSETPGADLAALELSIDGLDDEPLEDVLDEDLEKDLEGESAGLVEELSMAPDTSLRESPEENEVFDEEFTIPDFTISEDAEGEAKNPELIEAENEEGMPEIELEMEEPLLNNAEMTEDMGSRMDESKDKEQVGEEEISLEDFGLDMASEPAKPSRPETAKTHDEHEELSIDDFMDGEDFSSPHADVVEEKEDVEPIDLDLSFDDTIDPTPLSFNDEEGDEDEAPSRVKEEIETDEVLERAEIEAEEVTEFDDFLESGADSPQAFRSSQADVNGGTSRAELSALSEIEEIHFEDQTSLVTEMSDGLSIDAAPQEDIDQAPRPINSISLDSSETDLILDNIEDMDNSTSIGPDVFEEPDPQASEVDDPGETDEFHDMIAAADLPTEEGQSDGTEYPPDFDDLSAVEDDLILEEDQVAGQKLGDSDTSLLQKIAEELSTIKSEISSLKDELSALRTAPREVLKAAEPSDAAQKQAGGFFDEEEDETIALTGDELDNILNTADFTEEVGAPSEEGDSSPILEDIISLDGSESPNAIEESLDSDQGSIDISPRDLKDDKGLAELNRAANEGFKPMTEVPEDTSYLEEPIGEEIEELSIPDTPLEEPDLSEFTDTATEFSPDEELGDLETEESPIEFLDEGQDDIALDADTTLEEGQDITLDLETESDPGTELVAESEQAIEQSKPDEMDISEDDRYLTEISLSDETASFEDTIDKVEEAQDQEGPLELVVEEEKAPVSKPVPAKAPEMSTPSPVPSAPTQDVLKQDIRSVLQYMDKLLEALPEEKIEEFARSEHFSVYKKLFEELGLV